MIEGRISFGNKEEAIFFINGLMEQFEIEPNEIGF
jgi:hypothetical protein